MLRLSVFFFEHSWQFSSYNLIGMLIKVVYPISEGVRLFVKGLAVLFRSLDSIGLFCLVLIKVKAHFCAQKL